MGTEQYRGFLLCPMGQENAICSGISWPSDLSSLLQVSLDNAIVLSLVSIRTGTMPIYIR